VSSFAKRLPSHRRCVRKRVASNGRPDGPQRDLLASERSASPAGLFDDRTRESHIEVFHFEGVLLDEITARLYFVAHERGEDVFDPGDVL
jgi:hypothetical protein